VLSLCFVFGALFYKSFSGLMEVTHANSEKTPLIKDAKDPKDEKSMA